MTSRLLTLRKLADVLYGMNEDQIDTLALSYGMGGSLGEDVRLSLMINSIDHYIREIEGLPEEGLAELRAHPDNVKDLEYLRELRAEAKAIKSMSLKQLHTLSKNIYDIYPDPKMASFMTTLVELCWDYGIE